MVNQTAISVKIDSVELERLDLLCKSLGCKRSRLINFAIHSLNENMNIHSDYVSQLDIPDNYIITL